MLLVWSKNIKKISQHFPEEEKIKEIQEPYVNATIISPKDYIGEIMKLANSKRGEFVDMQYISVERVEIKYVMPLSEIIVDFFNLLKSISAGFASLDFCLDVPDSLS